MEYKIFLILLVSLNISYSQDSTWAVYDTSNSILPTNYINTIVIDSSNTKWIGTVKGLVKISTQGCELYNSTNTPLPHNNITSIAVDHNGCLWVGTIDGLVFYNMDSWLIYTKDNSNLLENRIFSLTVDSTNRVWIGSSNGQIKVGGLSIFDGITWTNFTTDNSDLPDSRILSIKIENENLAWLGTIGGLVKFQKGEMKIYDSSNSKLHSSYIGSIDIDKNGNKWIANRASAFLFGDVDPGGLIMMEDTNMTVYDDEIPDFPSYFNSINTVCVDKNNNVWFGMERQVDENQISGSILGFYNNIEWNFYLRYFSDRITSIAFDKNNQIWIGTYAGVVTSDTLTSINFNSNSFPNEISLHQNFPNPFNPTTQIIYSTSKPGMVSLKIFDTTGREIETLVNEFDYPGNYLVKFDARDLSTGIYFYKLKINNIYKIKKMVLIK
jgi:ligand-binding sensor domain-containing protein